MKTLNYEKALEEANYDKTLRTNIINTFIKGSCSKVIKKVSKAIEHHQVDIATDYLSGLITSCEFCKGEILL